MNHRTEQLIESYFSGTLNDAETLELKALLASDNTAAAEFAWQQSLAQQVSKLSLSKSIQNDDWRRAAKLPYIQVTMWRKALAAAAAIALLVVAYYYIPNSNSSNTEALVAESFDHFPNKMKFKNLGGSTEVVSPDVLEAFAEYDQKNYDLAAKKMIAVVNANPTQSEYRFYLGVCFVGDKKYFEAINALTGIAQDSSSTYRTPAQYYLGVAHAGINDFGQAKKYLEAYVAAGDGITYQKQAKKLLKSMK